MTYLLVEVGIEDSDVAALTVERALLKALPASVGTMRVRKAEGVELYFDVPGDEDTDEGSLTVIAEVKGVVLSDPDTNDPAFVVPFESVEDLTAFLDACKSAATE